MKPELIFDTKSHLGEGPAWDVRTQTLYWVDIFAKRIYAGSDLLAELDGYVGCVAPRQSGGLIAAFGGDGERLRFASLDADSAKPTLLSALADEPSSNRFNDGKCDPRGRFLAGTMSMNETEPTGSLYSFDGKAITKLLGNVTISNGMTLTSDLPCWMKSSFGSCTPGLIALATSSRSPSQPTKFSAILKLAGPQ